MPPPVWSTRVSTQENVVDLAHALATGLRARYVICETCVPTDEDALRLWEIAAGDEEMMQTLVEDAHEIGMSG